MGCCMSTEFFRRKYRNRRIVLLMIGLDNAGKTQTVNTIKGVKENVTPTVGFKAVNLVHQHTPVTIYDLGGGSQFRSIWPQYYSEVHGIIFVLDASDTRRISECKTVIWEVISHERVAGKPVLILANKQDLKGAMEETDIVQNLDLEVLVNRYRCPTRLEGYTALDETSPRPKMDPGLKKGYAWLLGYISQRYGDINLRVQTDIHAELERRKRQSSRLSAEETTGFENPNYLTPAARTTLEDEKKSPEDNGVIVVRPINHKFDSERAADHAEENLGNVKNFYSSTQETVSVYETADEVADVVLTDLDKIETSPDTPLPEPKKAEYSVAESRSQTSPNVEVNPVETDKISAKSPVGRTLTLPVEPSRPSSASQILRRQLEAAPRRRFSLTQAIKYSPGRNRTAPMTLFHYEPTNSSKSAHTLPV